MQAVDLNALFKAELALSHRHNTLERDAFSSLLKNLKTGSFLILSWVFFGVERQSWMSLSNLAVILALARGGYAASSLGMRIRL
jgi:hypothetical protein